MANENIRLCYNLDKRNKAQVKRARDTIVPKLKRELELLKAIQKANSQESREYEEYQDEIDEIEAALERADQEIKASEQHQQGEFF